MEQILRGGFGLRLNSSFSKLNRNKGTVRWALLVTLKYGPHFKECLSYSTLSCIPSKKSVLLCLNPVETIPKRGYGMFLVRAVKGVMKLRYLLLGGAVSGGFTLQKTYEDWKNNLPDIKWVNNYLPSSEKWNEIRVSAMDLTDKFKDIEVDPKLKELFHSKYETYKKWFDERLDKAFEAAERSSALRSDSESNNPSRGFLRALMLTDNGHKMKRLLHE